MRSRPRSGKLLAVALTASALLGTACRQTEKAPPPRPEPTVAPVDAAAPVGATAAAEAPGVPGTPPAAVAGQLDVVYYYLPG
jgi:hypothetical protein